MDLGQARWLKIPLVLGGVPLMVGVAVFILWLVTDWNWVPLVGIFTLYAGLVSVLAGLVCLGVGILKIIRAGVWSRGLMGRTVLVGVVLITNFPVAGSILWTAADLATTYKVIVRNHASAPIQLAALTGGGVSLQIGQIEPGASITKRFHIAQDGTLMFSAKQSGRKLNVIVDGYVTNSLGGFKEIDVFTDGTINVRSRVR